MIKKSYIHEDVKSKERYIERINDKTYINLAR